MSKKQANESKWYSKLSVNQPGVISEYAVPGYVTTTSKEPYSNPEK